MATKYNTRTFPAVRLSRSTYDRVRALSDATGVSLGTTIEKGIDLVELLNKGKLVKVGRKETDV